MEDDQFFQYFISTLSLSHGKAITADDDARSQEIYDTFLLEIKEFNPQGEPGEADQLFSTAYSHIAKLRYLDPVTAAPTIFTQARTEELFRQLRKRLAGGNDMLQFTRKWAEDLAQIKHSSTITSHGWEGFQRLICGTYHQISKEITRVRKSLELTGAATSKRGGREKPREDGDTKKRGDSRHGDRNPMHRVSDRSGNNKKPHHSPKAAMGDSDHHHDQETPSKRECYICGNWHGAKCRYQESGHLNVNLEKVPFKDSTQGRLVKEHLGRDTISSKVQITIDGKEIPFHYHPSESSGDTKKRPREQDGHGRNADNHKKNRYGDREVRPPVFLYTMTSDKNEINPLLSVSAPAVAAAAQPTTDLTPEAARAAAEKATRARIAAMAAANKTLGATEAQALVADGVNNSRVKARGLLTRQDMPQALLDTGGSLSALISMAQLHALKNNTNVNVYDVPNFDLRTLHGTSVISKYILLNLELSYKKRTITLKNTKFYVVDDLPFAYIIGLPTIRKFNLTRTFATYFTDANERQYRSELSRHAVNEYLNRVSDRIWLYAQDEKQNNHTISGKSQKSGQPMDPPGQWIRPNGLPTPPMDGPNPDKVPLRKVVDKTVLLGEDDYDHDHIDELGQDNPWQDYFNKSQQQASSQTKELFPNPAMDNEPKWNIQCSAEDQPKVQAVLEKHEQRFRATVGREPATLPAFELHIDRRKWNEIRTNQGYVRPQSVEKQAAMEAFIQQALADGVITESQASRFSQVLLTPKVDGSWRFCVDYRLLNSCCESSGWPIPNIKTMLNSIGSKRPKYFAVMDLTSGYHQAPIAKADQPYTAFITHRGLYQWVRVPMGPKGAPAYFQYQMVNTVFPGLVHNILEVYLDDICTWSDTIEGLCDNLEKIFQRLEQHNITLNRKKCRFGMSEVEYVGHVIDEHGLTFSPKKLDKISTFRKPERRKDLKSFLGLASYFREHIDKYADMAAPLHGLIESYTTKGRNNKLEWTPEGDAAFEKLKAAIINCPKIHWLTPGYPIFVNTDASDYGIGAYLYQKIDGKEIPISFLSKTLSRVERKWSTIEKEAYAIFYALSKWEMYLRDTHFTLKTDHANLTYLRTEHKQKVQRWKLAIQQYSFQIEHVAGIDNIAADGFSRFCPYTPDEEEEQHTLMSFAATLLADDVVQQHIHKVAPARRAERTRDGFKDHVIPDARYKVISKCHNTQVGHFKVEKTIERVRTYIDKNNLSQKFTGWTNADLRKDVTAFIKKCPCCQKMQVIRPAVHARPYTTSTWGVFDNLAIDVITGLPESTEGYKNLMVIVDTFSRYIELHPMGSLTAESAAHALRQWMSRYGRPLNILTDNASQFLAEYEATLDALGIENQKIHPYSHEENAIVERANKEVLRHLRDILYDTKVLEEWTRHIPDIQRIKNSTRVFSTGMTPHELVFGLSSRLEEGILYPHQPAAKAGSMQAYINKQRNIQQQALDAAYKHQDKIDNAHVISVKPTLETEFDIGSYVLVQYENDDHRPPTKVHPKLRGPFKVMAVTRRNQLGSIYTCQNLESNELADFHVKLLVPFHYDARYTNPDTEALVDKQMFVVETVLEHIFESKRQLKSDLKFLIKWVGYKQPSWEPYANVAKVGKVHEYLRENHMDKYIRDAYRPEKTIQPRADNNNKRPEPTYEEGSRQSERQPRKARRFDD